MNKPVCTSYKILITYTNGNKEEVKYDKLINRNSFKEMRDFYNKEVKPQYENDKNIATIEFVGITSDERLKILWTKEVNILTTEEKYILENRDKDVREIVRNIKNEMECLISMKKYHLHKLSECDRERSSILHEIVASKNKKFEDEEYRMFKDEIFERQMKNEEQRRLSKHNISELSTMFGELPIERIIGCINKWSRDREDYTETPEEFKDRVKKEFTYKTEKERLHHIKQHQNKYDFVDWYVADKKLVFVGHVGQGKVKYENRPFKINKIL
ncbi:MAG: hypothetical protein ACRC1T_05080 [Clostridium chrysemydis]|uniref:hypothetical protein n=1 Tax=Clostridium chrysemydis TaxID=2665504 RepID=UPI003F2A593A